MTGEALLQNANPFRVAQRVIGAPVVLVVREKLTIEPLWVATFVGCRPVLTALVLETHQKISDSRVFLRLQIPYEPVVHRQDACRRQELVVWQEDASEIGQRGVGP